MTVSGAASKSSRGLPSIPHPSPFWLGWFTWYIRRFLRQHFHAVHLRSPELLDVPGDQPAFVYVNHASWWDPLVGLLISRERLPDWTHYGAMDQDALESYRFFRRLGFFGVERGSPRGALEFLRVVDDLGSRPRTMIWITPQGRYADVRERPIRLMPGLSRMVSRLQTGTLIPLAIEYPFWEERLPEITASFGEPIRVADLAGLSAEQIEQRLGQQLSNLQDELADLVIRRQRHAFDVILSGRQGIGSVYGYWRAVRAKLTGRNWESISPTRIRPRPVPAGSATTPMSGDAALESSPESQAAPAAHPSSIER